MRKSISPLGETEIEVLNHVWDFGEATVKDVLSRVRKDRDVAYTTIMTVMKNLAENSLFATPALLRRATHVWNFP